MGFKNSFEFRLWKRGKNVEIVPSGGSTQNILIRIFIFKLQPRGCQHLRLFETHPF